MYIRTSRGNQEHQHAWVGVKLLTDVQALVRICRPIEAKVLDGGALENDFDIRQDLGGMRE